MMFSITAEDIAACRLSGESPIEVAINRRLRTGFCALVLREFGIKILERLSDHVAGSCPTPEPVQAFARDYYAGQDVAPIKFELPGLSPWFVVR